MSGGRREDRHCRCFSTHCLRQTAVAEEQQLTSGTQAKGVAGMSWRPAHEADMRGQHVRPGYKADLRVSSPGKKQETRRRQSREVESRIRHRLSEPDSRCVPPIDSTAHSPEDQELLHSRETRGAVDEGRRRGRPTEQHPNRKHGRRDHRKSKHASEFP